MPLRQELFALSGMMLKTWIMSEIERVSGRPVARRMVRLRKAAGASPRTCPARAWESTSAAGSTARAIRARRRSFLPQLSFQRKPVSFAIRFETALPVMSPAGSPPPGEIHWPTM